MHFVQLLKHNGNEAIKSLVIYLNSSSSKPFHFVAYQFWFNLVIKNKRRNIASETRVETRETIIIMLIWTPNQCQHSFYFEAWEWNIWNNKQQNCQWQMRLMPHATWFFHSFQFASANLFIIRSICWAFHTIRFVIYDLL